MEKAGLELDAYLFIRAVFSLSIEFIVMVVLHYCIKPKSSREIGFDGEEKESTQQSGFWHCVSMSSNYSECILYEEKIRL